MTSQERKEARYLRRKQEREKKRLEAKAEYDNFDKVVSPDALMKAAKEATKGIGWKTSPQRYNMDIASLSIITSEKLYKGEDLRKGFIVFYLIERGKLRKIQSVHFSERVIQKSMSKNALVPILQRELIYDNGACIEGKGYTFHIDRMEQKLHDFYNKYGDNHGYILLLDLTNFFGSIPHKQLKERIAEKVDDIRLLELICDCIDAFEGDKGLGLGSESCQIEAVFYPSPVDHYITDQLGYGGYERYMDDSGAIGRTKEELEEIKPDITKRYADLGLTVSEAKTKIVPIDKPFVFLKTKFKLDENGGVMKRPVRGAIGKERKKLRKFKEKYDSGEMTYDQVNSAYQSWRGYMSRKDTHFEIQEMDKFFKENFTDVERRRRQEANRQKQLDEHPNSKRQQKKQRYLEKQAKKEQAQVPTIMDENKVNRVIEQKIRDASAMTDRIGRQTRDYQDVKKKKREGKPGRKRAAQGMVEVLPDTRMSSFQVMSIKDEVERKKKEKITPKNPKAK